MKYYTKEEWKREEAIMDLVGEYCPHHKEIQVSQQIFKRCQEKYRDRISQLEEKLHNAETAVEASLMIYEMLKKDWTKLHKALEQIEMYYTDGENTYDDWNSMGRIAQESLKE